VGYVHFPSRNHNTHNPSNCRAEHCSCHLPRFFSPPSLELTGREALVLLWHLFPADGDEGLSFEAIGARLGVMPERIRQIYTRAGNKLRAHARVHYPPPPGTPEYEERMAAAEEYKLDHPEYAQKRALLDALAAHESTPDLKPNNPG
jgi:hypothetical protein